MPAPVTKETRLASLYARIAGFSLPYVKPAKRVSWGFHDARLMVVFGHALTDILGLEMEYLRLAFKLAEIDKAETFFSYAIRGSLMRKHGGELCIESREPYQDEVDAYRPLLLEEISIIRPSCVLCVGGTAIKTLTGDTDFSVTKRAGAEVDAGVSCPVIATVSFGYVVKTGGKHSRAHAQFVGDLKHAKQLAENPHP